MRFLIFVLGIFLVPVPSPCLQQVSPPGHPAASSSAPARRNSEDSAALWAQARTALDHGDFQEAKRVLALAVKANPGDASLWFHLGVACSQLGELDPAITALERARRLAPKQPATYFDLGLLYWKNGDLGKAKQAYRSGLALSPKEPSALQNYALLLMKTGEYQSAISPLLQLKNDANLSVPARVSLIECYLKTQAPERADREANDLLRAGISQPADQTKLAGIFLENGATTSAVRLLTHSLELDPNQDKACATLGVIYLREKRFDEAAPLLERAVNLDPNSAEYAMAFAQTLFLWNHSTALLAFLDSVKSKFSSLPEFQFALGLAYYGNSQYTNAASTLEGVLQAHPRREDQVDFWLGNSYLALGRLDESAKAYRAAIEINPKNPEYYESYATLLRREGPEKLDDAIAQLKHAYQYNPQDPRIALQLALCYESKDNLADAAALLEKAVQRDPSLAAAHVALARIYGRLGQKAKAQQEAETVKTMQDKVNQEKMKASPAAQSPLDEQP